MKHYSDLTDQEKHLVNEYKSWVKSKNHPETFLYKLNRLEYYAKLLLEKDLQHLIN